MKCKSILVLALAAMVFLPGLAKAAEFSLGGGAGFSSSPYKGYDQRVRPVPLVSYDGDRFYIRGLGAGVHLWKEGWHTLSLGASYSWLHFNSANTDDSRLRRLDDRHSTVMADLTYSIATDWGIGTVKISRDILGNSDAFTGDASYRYPIRMGDFTLTPGAGMQWASADQVDYYFGVSSKESRRSGLARYEGDDAFSPYLLLGARYRITPQWSVVGAAQVVFLSDEIRDSPMVDAAQTTNVTAGIQYSF